MDRRVLGWDLDCNRGVYSDYTVLFLGRRPSGNHVLWHQFGGAFSRRRVEIIDHDPFLVGVGPGNDLDRYHRRRRDVWFRARLWRPGLNATLARKPLNAQRPDVEIKNRQLKVERWTFLFLSSFKPSSCLQVCLAAVLRN